MDFAVNPRPRWRSARQPDQCSDAEGPANPSLNHSNGSAQSITIGRAGTLALCSPDIDETGHEPLQILHRPADLRRRAVDADLPRRPARRCRRCRSPNIPEVVPPSVVVRAQYPGANPKVIAETVATPIEEQINGVEGMLYMSSQATTDGLMTLTVTFKLGTDPDKAQQLVQNRVAQAEPRLPEEVRRLGVTTIKSSPDLTMVVHLLSPNDRYDMTYLRNYAVLNVKDRLARIEGVGEVQLFGSGDYSMRVWLDPQKVAERGLSAERRGRARSAAQNVQAAAGVVGASPSDAGRRPAALDQRAGPAADRGGIRRHHRQDRRQRRGHAAARRRAHRARRRGLFAALAAGQQVRGRDADLPGAGLERDPDLRRRPRDDGRAEEEHARRRGLQHRLRPDAVRARLDRGGRAHAARGRGAGRAGRHPVPADLARVDHSADRGAGFDHRHLRGDASCSASRSTR